VSPEAAEEQDPTAARWDALLTDLEARVSSGTPGTWAEPADIGPLPRTLAGRASRLLAAQRDAMAAIEAEKARVVAHLGALRAVAESKEPTRSVYLDVTG
jgi:hypothetical protein